MAKLAVKPYPDIQAVANAYRLCCMKAPVAKEISPLAMLSTKEVWDYMKQRGLPVRPLYDRGYTSIG